MVYANMKYWIYWRPDFVYFPKKHFLTGLTGWTRFFPLPGRQGKRVIRFAEINAPALFYRLAIFLHLRS
jgi:hypothetical protein